LEHRRAHAYRVTVERYGVTAGRRTGCSRARARSCGIPAHADGGKPVCTLNTIESASLIYARRKHREIPIVLERQANECLQPVVYNELTPLDLGSGSAGGGGITLVYGRVLRRRRQFGPGMGGRKGTRRKHQHGANYRGITHVSAPDPGDAMSPQRGEAHD